MSGPTSRLVRVDPTTGAQTALASGGNFGNPTGITVFASVSAVPEPFSIVFLSLGLGGLYSRRYLSSKK